MNTPAMSANAIEIEGVVGEAPLARGSVRYLGLDGEVIERSDSQFPQPPTDAEEEAPHSALPLMSLARWWDLLAS